MMNMKWKKKNVLILLSTLTSGQITLFKYASSTS